MIAIIYDQAGYLIGTNAYLTEDDDVQLPHFFVEELPPELENIPANQRVKINPETHEITYEALPTAPDPGPTAAERITQLEAENAGMALELAQNQIRFDQMEQANADLLFALVDKGVL
ncbi:hypothetical protein [Paenibacillus sp. YN15]|uniref:hypothetical protein n=1 Tax=Paenibacillus sp. YN15 TaxID=1742774 RepID=UPI000DCD0503|nr:hypothetical protein [Paenibacillus sp. YN15]RAU98123.1 hypothetical protein DQG13_17685 [Paenibacillus sp. YN15]